jgi:hypothetical protein
MQALDNGANRSAGLPDNQLQLRAYNRKHGAIYKE